MNDSFLLEIRPRLPIEVCERIIKAIYDNRFSLVPVALTTLSACALVCRTWRAPVQKVLFKLIIIRDKDSLYRFASLLDASPELGSYVLRLQLRGRLHVPYSPVVLVTTVLRGRLMNLRRIDIVELGPGSKAATVVPLSEGKSKKELKTLPLHRYFPSLVASISHIRQLGLKEIRFSSFGELARMLNTLCNLESLGCQRVFWDVLGQELPCMMKNHRDSQLPGATFLPNLHGLACFEIDGRGRQRLLSALGPSLWDVRLKFPDGPPQVSPKQQKSPNSADDVALAPDLRNFPNIYRIMLQLAPLSDTDVDVLEMLRVTLASWVASEHDRFLYFSPYSRPEYRREDFVKVLRTIGSVVERALCTQEPSSDLGHDGGPDTSKGNEDDARLPTLTVADLEDRLEWEDWWRAQIEECFPTFARCHRVKFHYPNLSAAPNCQWVDYDLAPPDLPDKKSAIQLIPTQPT